MQSLLDSTALLGNLPSSNLLSGFMDQAQIMLDPSHFFYHDEETGLPVSLLQTSTT